MKLFKKLFSLLLVLVIGLAFTACKGKGGGDEDDTPIDTGTIAEDYGTWTGQALEITAIDKGIGVTWLRDAVKVFNKATGSEISVKADETLNEALEVYLSASKNSDIYFTFSSEAQWVRWSMQEKIVPLEDIGLVYDKAVENVGVYENTRYIMPYTYSPTGFVYNKDYIEQIPSYGEFTQGTFPKTWQGLLDMCYSVNNNWNKTALGQKVVPMSWGASVGDMSYIFKGLWAQIDPTGYYNYWNQETVSVAGQPNKSLLVNQNTIQAMDCIAQLINPQKNVQGSYYPANSFADSTGHSNLIAQQKFLNGLSVFTISGSWFEQEMSEQIEDSEIDFYHFATLPIVNEGSDETIYMNSPAEYFMVTANGKNNNKPLAKAFLKFLASEERLQVFHATTGVPAALKYNYNTQSLTGFAKEVAEAVFRSECVVSASDKKAAITGVLNMNLTWPFVQIATEEYTASTASSLINELYSRQVTDWDDYFDGFN